MRFEMRVFKLVGRNSRATQTAERRPQTYNTIQFKFIIIPKLEDYNDLIIKLDYEVHHFSK